MYFVNWPPTMRTHLETCCGYMTFYFSYICNNIASWFIDLDNRSCLNLFVLSFVLSLFCFYEDPSKIGVSYLSFMFTSYSGMAYAIRTKQSCFYYYSYEIPFKEVNSEFIANIFLEYLLYDQSNLGFQCKFQNFFSLKFKG